MFWRIIGSFFGFTWIIAALQIWGDPNCDSITYSSGGRRALGFACQTGGIGAGEFAFLFLLIGASLIVYAVWPFVVASRGQAATADTTSSDTTSSDIIVGAIQREFDKAIFREIADEINTEAKKCHLGFIGSMFEIATAVETNIANLLYIRLFDQVVWVFKVHEESGLLTCTCWTSADSSFGQGSTYSNLEIVTLDGEPLNWRERDAASRPRRITLWILVKMGLTFDMAARNHSTLDGCTESRGELERRNYALYNYGFAKNYTDITEYEKACESYNVKLPPFTEKDNRTSR